MEPEVCFVRSLFLNDFDLKFAIEYLVFDQNRSVDGFIGVCGAF